MQRRTNRLSTLACEAEARQALSTVEPDVQTIYLAASTVCAQPRHSTRDRPGLGARPHQVVDQIDAALASTRTSRQALLGQRCCVILAIHELDKTQLPAQEMLAGYNGQGHVERGFRWLKDPQFFVSSLDREKPERIMARLMLRTVCSLVDAALEYRIRQEDVLDPPLTKTNHPWTNGQVERMNRTLKDATMKKDYTRLMTT